MSLYQNKTILVVTALVVVFLSFVVIFDNPGNFGDTQTNRITGDVVNTKVEVFPTQFKNCSFQLHPGWNMVSFYCFGLFVPRSNALSSVSGSYSSIFEYQSNDYNDHWKSYNPYLPNWTIQQLNYMDRITGYWIYMFNNATFTYAGVYSNSNIYLYDGWNLVGYPNTNSSDINVSLNGIPYTLAKYYNSTIVFDNITNTTIITGATWWIHLYNGSNNTLNQFDTYRGYWVNVTGDSIWTIVR